MQNREKYFMAACAGMPFGLVGMSVGVFLTWIFNTISGRK